MFIFLMWLLENLKLLWLTLVACIIYPLDNTDTDSLLLPLPCLYRWILSATQSPELENLPTSFEEHRAKELLQLVAEPT